MIRVKNKDRPVKFRIVVWDIETHSFHSDVGFLITSAIKPLGSKAVVHTNRHLGKNSLNDRELCIAVRNELERADWIVSFYGLGFDLKFLNSRLLYWNEKTLTPKLHTDLYRLGKRFFNTSRRSLAVITAHLGIPGKTHVDLAHWKEAAWNGDKKALNYIVKHNIADVKITEKLFLRLKNLIKSVSLA